MCGKPNGEEYSSTTDASPLLGMFEKGYSLAHNWLNESSCGQVGLGLLERR